MPTKLSLGEEERIREGVVAPLCGLYAVFLVVVAVEGYAALEPVCQVTALNPDSSHLGRDWCVVSPLVKLLVSVEFYPVIMQFINVVAQSPKLLGVGVSSHDGCYFLNNLLVQLFGGFLAMG